MDFDPNNRDYVDIFVEKMDYWIRKFLTAPLPPGQRHFQRKNELLDSKICDSIPPVRGIFGGKMGIVFWWEAFLDKKIMDSLEKQKRIC